MLCQHNQPKLSLIFRGQWNCHVILVKRVQRVCSCRVSFQRLYFKDPRLRSSTIWTKYAKSIPAAHKIQNVCKKILLWEKVLEEYKGKRNLDAHSLELDFLQCWFDIFQRRGEHQSWNIWILSDQIAKPCWMATCNFKSDLLSWKIQILFLGPLLYISFSIALLTTVMMMIIQPSPAHDSHLSSPP